MAKRTLQKNFNISNDIKLKLSELRNYHNKTYDNLFEILIENAFLQMSEATNLNKAKELDDKNLKISFQVQQLTLMFAELKKENAEIKTYSSSLTKQLDELKATSKELNGELQAQEVKNKERSTKYSGEIGRLNKWAEEKDKSLWQKIKG
jgi:hypothetical protein